MCGARRIRRPSSRRRAGKPSVQRRLRAPGTSTASPPATAQLGGCRGRVSFRVIDSIGQIRNARWRKITTKTPPSPTMMTGPKRRSMVPPDHQFNAARSHLLNKVSLDGDFWYRRAGRARKRPPPLHRRSRYSIRATPNRFCRHGIRTDQLDREWRHQRAAAVAASAARAGPRYLRYRYLQNAAECVGARLVRGNLPPPTPRQELRRYPSFSDC